MATLANPIEETLPEFELPQELRRDIQVPATVLAKWDRETVREPQLRPVLERIVQYRQHVLAIFENLICHDAATQKLQ
jgi:hypothetical protein